MPTYENYYNTNNDTKNNSYKETKGLDDKEAIRLKNEIAESNLKQYITNKSKFLKKKK